MYELSILLPARNEMFLGRTIQDILQNIDGKTEIIAVLDGYTDVVPEIPDDSRVRVIKHDVSIGQRASTNVAARASVAKYLMKVDAHCAFDKGFDVKMMAEMHDDWTMAPLMKNLHAFDWVCPDGHRRYQGPSGPCKDCGKETVRDVVWIAKKSPNSISYCFDAAPHFQYFGEFSKRPDGKGDVTESMSLQGSCFMCTRDKYWELGLCDEKFGSWGSQGIEVACKTWLSGGRVMVNHKTWYAHMFRTQGGDFGFPYHNPHSRVEVAKQTVRDVFFNNRWEKQTHPLHWLVEKFWPVKGWSEDDLRKLRGEIANRGIIYYSDCRLDEKIAQPVRDRLLQISKDKSIPIVSSTLKGMDFGVRNIRFPSLKRGYLSMFKQILAALEHSTADIIYFCEHDVLYHPSHFDFTPPDRQTYYYNQNVVFWRTTDGHALRYDVNQLSGLCVYRDTALIHFRERYELAEQKYKELSEDEFNKWVRLCGFEPMTHGRIQWKNVFKYDGWKSLYPNLDIKHGANATGVRWKKEQYRNQHLLVNWKESSIDKIEGWKREDWEVIIK